MVSLARTRAGILRQIQAQWVEITFREQLRLDLELEIAQKFPRNGDVRHIDYKKAVADRIGKMMVQYLEDTSIQNKLAAGKRLDLLEARAKVLGVSRKEVDATYSQAIRMDDPAWMARLQNRIDAHLFHLRRSYEQDARRWTPSGDYARRTLELLREANSAREANFLMSGLLHLQKQKSKKTPRRRKLK